jgi:demethylmenaquinone methyltransferase/2-methoxy-6-polyprenyl-1,4-benzoquinol methylase
LDSLRAFFESLAEEWDAQQPPNRDEIIRQMLAAFDTALGSAKAILEVGTGTGALIPQLRVYAPAARIISIDMAEAMLHLARRRCLEASLVQCDVHRLPFSSALIGPNAFDIVISHNSFPHFTDPHVAIAEFARVLIRGGHILIIHDLGREQVNAIHQGSSNSVIHNDLLPPITELAKMLENFGFEIIDCEDSESRYTMHACLPAR